MTATILSNCAESRILAYASGNFDKALIFGGADLTIVFW